VNKLTINVLIASAITGNLMSMNPTPPKPPVAIKAPTSLEEVDTTDFPYVWQYKKQAEDYVYDRANYRKNNPISQQQAFKVLNHPLCTSLNQKLRDEATRKKIQAASLDQAFDAPKNWFGSVTQLDDPNAQIQNDKAMAIYNCAAIQDFFSRRMSSEKIIDDFLAEKEDAHEQKH
jgi:hypothetical protein